MTQPTGDLGGGYPGVEPQGGGRVAKVVRPARQRRGRLVCGQGEDSRLRQVAV